MSRYINADKLIEHLNAKSKTDYEMGLYNHGALTESFIRFVERQPPADVVEVVRCKDCKYWHNEGYDPILERCCGTCRHEYSPTFDYAEVEENDFCSYGERREE